MARFGTGIQAGLGAINYAPYMQGAVAGSQSIAQGIAALGQAAGGAINTYYAKKEEEDKKQKATSAFIKTIEANPAAFQTYFKDGNLDKDAVRAVVDVLGFQGTIQLNSYLAESAKQQKAETERLASKRDEDQVNELLQADSTGMLDQVISKATPAARAKFEQVRQQQQAQSVQLDLARSQIAENFAQARAAGMPRSENVAVEEAQVRANIRAEEEKTGRPITAAREAAIRAAVSEGRSKNTTYDATQKDKERANLFEFLGKQRSEEINPILRADTASRRVDELLAEGNLITGKTAQAELYLKSVANDLGIGDYEEAKNTEKLIALIGQQVLRNIKALGSGTAVSDADRIYTEKISGADITKQLQGIRELQNILNTQSRDSIDRFNRKVSGAFDEGDRYRNLLIVSPEDAPFMLIESRKKKQPMDATEIYDANTRTFKPIFGPSL